MATLQTQASVCHADRSPGRVSPSRQIRAARSRAETASDAIAAHAFVLDPKGAQDYLELGAAGWLTLRFRLTVVASLSCFVAAAQI